MRDDDVRVLDLFKQAGKPIHIRDTKRMAEHLGITSEALGKSLMRLVKSGDIYQDRTERKLMWRLTT